MGNMGGEVFERSDVFKVIINNDIYKFKNMLTNLTKKREIKLYRT